MTEQRERVERFSEELREGPEPSDRSIKEILDALRPQMQELVNKQVELAKTELVPVGRQAGVATGLLVVGAVFMRALQLAEDRWRVRGGDARGGGGPTRRRPS